MDNIIVNLDGAIASIKIEEQKLWAEHISKIDIYNTELSAKVMEETFKKMTELNSWKETIEQTKQAIITSKNTPALRENIAPIVVKENDKVVGIISAEDLPTKLRTLAQHRFLFSTVFLMTDTKWAKDMFGLEHPFAKIYSDEIDLQEQVQDETGGIIYWQEVFTLGEKKFLITNQWTEDSKKKFASWYNNITQLNNAPKTAVDEKPLTMTCELVAKNNTHSHDLSKKPRSITLLGKKYKIDFWSEVFTKVCEIMVLRKPYLAAKFDQLQSLNTEQVNFSYQENAIKVDRKKLANGMWIEINRTAQESWQLAIKVLEVCGYKPEDMSLEY